MNPDNEQDLTFLKRYNCKENCKLGEECGFCFRKANEEVIKKKFFKKCIVCSKLVLNKSLCLECDNKPWVKKNDDLF